MKALEATGCCTCLCAFFSFTLQASGEVNGTVDVYLKWRYTYLPASAKPRVVPQVMKFACNLVTLLRHTAYCDLDSENLFVGTSLNDPHPGV